MRNTQIQTKLGQNIDAVLTAQFLSNLLDRKLKGIDKKRVERCLDICVSKIQNGTDADGKQGGAGWAGVLQSGLANSALESAQAVGVEVDEEVLERSRNYQKGNYNDKTARLWDFKTGKLIKTFSGHNGAITYVKITPDGKRLITSSRDGSVKIWDLESGKIQNRFIGHVSFGDKIETV